MNGAEVTPKKKDRFISRLANCGCVSKSANYAGFSRRQAYRLRNPDEESYDPEFAAGWDEAIEHYTERLETEADRRALEGLRKLKFDRNGDALVDPDTGETYEEREYSDTLLIFRLKALKPDKYRDNAKVDLEHSGGVTLTVKYDELLGEDEPAAGE